MEINIFPENFEQKIDFIKVREHIKEKCLSTLGEEKVDLMCFSTDHDTVLQALRKTEEFISLIHAKEDLPTTHYIDLRATVEQVGQDPTYWLVEKDIFLMTNSLTTVERIVNIVATKQTKSSGNASYPELKKMASSLILLPHLITLANTIVDATGGIKDNASKLLATIRKHKIDAHKEVNKAMAAALRTAQAQGLVDADAQADVRGGHYLIPVTATNKRKIKGIVRDSSSSGKTFFIEPEAVVQASSRLRELEDDERIEKARILTSFTEHLRPQVSSILVAYNFLAEVDFIRAKALFAIRIKAIVPNLQHTPLIEWNQAIHPLLDIQLRQQQKEAKPLDIYLHTEERIILVSGVNAGGKSLCLKTVALLQYMLQCGIPIPVRQDSAAGIFTKLFMDIGDGQSLDNSLSTYTSHLTNMKHFVENSDAQTLILIDEFGGGTEPQIGGAIAEALLDKFNKTKSFALITTHFQNLKHYAYKTEGIVNAAMLFDSVNNRPTYTLAIGTPGSSYAIEVARRIGLSESIIEDATQKLGDDFSQMNDIIQQITQDRLYWEARRKEIDEIRISTPLPVEKEVLAVASSTSLIEPEKTIQVGSQVCIKGQSAVGVVTKITNTHALVTFGLFKSKIERHRLILTNP